MAEIIALPDLKKVRSWIEDVSEELEVIDMCDLECDGVSAVISMIFRRCGIDHKVFTGFVRDNQEDCLIFPHVWLELDLPLKYIVDIRLKNCIEGYEQDSYGIEIPNGVFRARDIPKRFDYIRSGQINFDEFSESEFEILTEGKYSEIKLPRTPSSRQLKI